MPDTFRSEYKQLSKESSELMLAIKSKASELEALYSQITLAGREKALALTNLEQSVMWATKAITA